MVASLSYQNGQKARSHPLLSLTGLIELPPSPLFGTDGIRGQVGELLTAPLALQIGFWAGQVFKKSGWCHQTGDYRSRFA